MATCDEDRSKAVVTDSVPSACITIDEDAGLLLLIMDDTGLLIKDDSGLLIKSDDVNG